jgi:hypothetical protein
MQRITPRLTPLRPRPALYPVPHRCFHSDIGNDIGNNQQLRRKYRSITDRGKLAIPKAFDVTPSEAFGFVRYILVYSQLRSLQLALCSTMQGTAQTLARCDSKERSNSNIYGDGPVDWLYIARFSQSSLFHTLREPLMPPAPGTLLHRISLGGGGRLAIGASIGLQGVTRKANGRPNIEGHLSTPADTAPFLRVGPLNPIRPSSTTLVHFALL